MINRRKGMLITFELRKDVTQVKNKYFYVYFFILRDNCKKVNTLSSMEINKKLEER